MDMLVSARSGVHVLEDILDWAAERDPTVAVVGIANTVDIVEKRIRKDLSDEVRARRRSAPAVPMQRRGSTPPTLDFTCLLEECPCFCAQ